MLDFILNLYIMKICFIKKDVEIQMKCKISKQCGSCKYINTEYSISLKEKYDYYQSLYKNFNVNVHEIIKMDYPYKYRNKVIVAFSQNYEYGMYEEHSHRIVPINDCLLHDDETNNILKKIQFLLKKYHVSIYNEKKHNGFLKYVLIRRAKKTNQTLITLVSTHSMFKGSKNFCNELIKDFPSIKSVVLNINKRKTSIVLSKEEKILYGKGFIVDELCGLTFKISSQSFYQINHEQCTKLYNQILNLLDVKGMVLDTYCGIGTIGMVLSKYVDYVIGVELNKEAYKDALNNARMNKINNIKFINQDASLFMKENCIKVDCIIMDPPRSGSTKEFIRNVKKMAPQSVIYVSCDPHTQVRDLKEFKQIGYHFNDVYLVDMFPFTNHIESIVKLVKN